MTGSFCFQCGGDAREPGHQARCDGRQGRVEAAFDREAGREARDQAVAQVAAHAVPEFLDAAVEAVRLVALRQAQLTTDDVWRQLGDDAPTTHERRAMGPVTMKAKAAGYVRPIEALSQSAMVSCHCRPKRVWQSLIQRVT